MEQQMKNPECMHQKQTSLVMSQTICFCFLVQTGMSCEHIECLNYFEIFILFSSKYYFERKQKQHAQMKITQFK